MAEANVTSTVIPLSIESPLLLIGASQYEPNVYYKPADELERQLDTALAKAETERLIGLHALKEGYREARH